MDTMLTYFVISSKIMFTTEDGNLIISSFSICFSNARGYSEKTLRRLTFKYFEKVAEFSISSSLMK